MTEAGVADLVPGIEGRIHLMCGQRVMLSPDLAELYGIETRALTQAVRRNLDRFPEDFQFTLSQQEFANLTSQTVTSSWGGTRKPLMTFADQIMTPPEPSKKKRIGFIQD